jgi:hypothetical protein
MSKYEALNDLLRRYFSWVSKRLFGTTKAFGEGLVAEVPPK